uniref:Uncharacterized protein n=1 Tax=Crocodylus porosus TaxID=8502 RepID=A0A7M4E5S4_CROPO
DKVTWWAACGPKSCSQCLPVTLPLVLGRAWGFSNKKERCYNMSNLVGHQLQADIKLQFTIFKPLTPPSDPAPHPSPLPTPDMGWSLPMPEQS